MLENFSANNTSVWADHMFDFIPQNIKPDRPRAVCWTYLTSLIFSSSSFPSVKLWASHIWLLHSVFLRLCVALLVQVGLRRKFSVTLPFLRHPDKPVYSHAWGMLARMLDTAHRGKTTVSTNNLRPASVGSLLLWQLCPCLSWIDWTLLIFSCDNLTLYQSIYHLLKHYIQTDKVGV